MNFPLKLRNSAPSDARLASAGPSGARTQGGRGGERTVSCVTRLERPRTTHRAVSGAAAALIICVLALAISAAPAAASEAITNFETTTSTPPPAPTPTSPPPSNSKTQATQKPPRTSSSTLPKASSATPARSPSAPPPTSPSTSAPPTPRPASSLSTPIILATPSKNVNSNTAKPKNTAGPPHAPRDPPSQARPK